MSKYIDIEGLKTYHGKIKEIIETPATSTTAGVVKPDNTTITISDDGTISAVSSLKIEVVDTLPTTDISTATIYFVPKTAADTDNVYSEYIYVNEKWELIGDTEVDLSEYMKKSEVSASASLTSGTKVGSITVNGTTTDLYSPEISFTQTQTEGTEIGTLNINGTDTVLYAPKSNSSDDLGGTTVFNSDGSIVTTYTDNSTLTVIFDDDDNVTETSKASDGTVTKTKQTTFNNDGSITEVIK